MSEEELPEVTGTESEGFVDVLEAERDLIDAKVQLESLLNATDALESLISHLDHNDIASEGHKHALMVSFENLVGSSGVGVQDVFPALLEHESGTISTESFKDKLKDLWKRLVAAVLSVLKFFKHFWNSIATYRGRLKLSAEHLAKKATVRRHVTVKTPTIDLGIEIKSFIVGDSVIKDPDALIRSVSAALDQYRIFTSQYGSRMLEIGKEFERSLQEGSTGVNKLRDVATLFAGMPFDNIASQMKAMVYRDPRFGRRLTMAAPPIIGGWTLFFLTLEQDQRQMLDSNPLAYAAAVRTTGVKFALTNVNFSNVTSGTVKTASGQQIEMLARRVLEILALIDTQERQLAISRIEAQVKNVLRAGDSYQNRTSYDSTSYDESVLRFVRNYASWAIGPVDQLTTNLLTVSRNLLTYGRRSLNAQ